MPGLLRQPPGGDTGRRPPLWLLLTFVVCGTLSLHILVPALPAMAVDLGVSDGSIQLALTVYVLSLAGGQLVYGPLSDRYGRRPVLLVGLLLYTLGGFAAAAAPNLPLLLAARVLQAAGGRSGLVLGRAVIRDTSSPPEAARRLALLNMCMSVAPALASIAGGALVVHVGWRSIFLLLAVAGVGSLAAALLILPETNPALGQRSVGLLRANVRLLRMPAFLGYAIPGAMATTTFYGFVSAAPFIFVRQMGVSPAQIGFLFLVPMAGFTVGSLAASRLAPRLRLRRMLDIGYALVLAGAVLVAAVVFGFGLSMGPLLGAMFLFTMGGGFVSPMALTGAISVLPGSVGAAAGLCGCLQMLWGAVCTLVVGLWHDNPAVTTATLLLSAATASQVLHLVASRRGQPS